jgi:hypothetical protein
MTFELFWYFAEENLPDIAHDIGRSNDDGNACDDSDQPLPAPYTHKDGELSDEAGEKRHAHGNQAANNKTNRCERHDFAHPTQLRDLACMRSIIDHTDDSKEESGHHTMREHLHTRAQQTLTVECGESQHHQAHVRNGRETNHVFEVHLHEGDIGPIHHSNSGKEHDQPGPGFCALRQEHDADA